MASNTPREICIEPDCVNPSHSHYVAVVGRPPTVNDARSMTGYDRVCHGETVRLNARAGDNEPLAFHLGISKDGTRLLLFRQGYVPQVIEVSELVNNWLYALGHDTGISGPVPAWVADPDIPADGGST